MLLRAYKTATDSRVQIFMAFPPASAHACCDDEHDHARVLPLRLQPNAAACECRAPLSAAYAIYVSVHDLALVQPLHSQWNVRGA